MPLPITAESVEAFAMRYLAQAEKTDDLLTQELRHDWAYSAALLLNQHRYYDQAARIFDRCQSLKSAMNA